MKQRVGHEKNSLNGESVKLSERSISESTKSDKKTRTSEKDFWHYKKVADYRLGKCIGEGSFAKVKLGLHIPTEQKVAVKIIKKDKIKNDSYMQKNLHREGKLLQMLRHPNVIQILDVLESANNYYLVTEYCPGGGLIKFTNKKISLPERVVWKYVRQLVDAVAHLHNLKIVHRDLKIENLLLDGEDNIKIIDFGLSNILPPLSSDLSCSLQTQCGSPAYAAPELLAKQSYGPKVDVWSIGVITFFLLVGKLPFTVKPFNVSSLIKKMLRGEINSFPESVSPMCRSFIRALLNPNHKQRPYIDEVLRHKWLSISSFPLKSSSLTTSFSSPEFRPSGEKTFFRLHGYSRSSYFHSQINMTVIDDMKARFGFKESDVVHSVKDNRPGSILSTYHLLLRKQFSLLKNKSLSERSIQEAANRSERDNSCEVLSKMHSAVKTTTQHSEKEYEESLQTSKQRILAELEPTNHSSEKELMSVQSKQMKSTEIQPKHEAVAERRKKSIFCLDSKVSGLESHSCSSQIQSIASKMTFMPTVEISSTSPLNTDNGNSEPSNKLTGGQSLRKSKNHLTTAKSLQESPALAFIKVPFPAPSKFGTKTSTFNSIDSGFSASANSSKISNQSRAELLNSKKQDARISNLSLRKSLPSRLNSSLDSEINSELSRRSLTKKRASISVVPSLLYRSKISEPRITKGNVREKINAFEKRKNLDTASSTLPVIYPGNKPKSNRKSFASQLSVTSNDTCKSVFESAKHQKDEEHTGKLLSRKWQKLYGEHPRKALLFTIETI